MKRFLKVYLFFVLLIISCNNNERELRLKEKELELKERELALRENESKNYSTNETESSNSFPRNTLTYIPSSCNPECPFMYLKYRFDAGANKPSISINFSDGEEFYGLPNNEGEYAWILKNKQAEEIAYFKASFYKQNKILKIKLEDNSINNNYTKYLIDIENTYKLN